MKSKSVETLIIRCILPLLIFILSSCLSAYAQDQDWFASGDSDSVSFYDKEAPYISLGLGPNNLGKKSSSNITRIDSLEGTVVDFDNKEREILYRTDNNNYLSGSYFISLQKHWLSSVNLTAKRLVAQKAVKNDEAKVILVRDKFAVLRQENSFSVFRQDNLQLLWERDFSSEFGLIASNIGVWPEQMVLIGQAEGQKSFICASVNLADGQIRWKKTLSGLFADLAVSSQFVYLAFTEENGYNSSQVHGAKGTICSLSLSNGRMSSSRQIIGLYRFYAGPNRLLTISCSDYGAKTAYVMELYSTDLQLLNSIGISFLPQWVNFSSKQIRALYSDLDSLERWNLCVLSAEDGKVLSHFEISNKLYQLVCDRDNVWFFIGIDNAVAVYLLQDNELISVTECSFDMEDSPYLGCSALILGNNLYAWGKRANSAVLSIAALDLKSRRRLGWSSKNLDSASLIPCGNSLAMVSVDNDRFTGEVVSRIKLIDFKKGGFSFTSEPIKGQIVSFGGDRALSAARSVLRKRHLEVHDDALIYLASSGGELTLLSQNGKILTRPLRSIFFDWTKLNNFCGVILLTGCILWYIAQANRGKKLFIREIAGLSALDEAVGRATEMGRPVLYIPGVGEIDDTQTMAALSVLGKVSSCTAEYGCSIMVPNCSPVVMSMAQDVVSQSYLKAGCPDSYVSDNICYLSGEQFGFAAGVCGIMVRERPAAVLYMGTFLAEALMLAETGNSTGAIQIAGTASASQLPFFVAACDYTLIGEELYAASAYLSNDPMQIGSLKGQDAAKAAIMVLIIAGIICLSCGGHWISYLW
ncbi:MAG: DUF6754 domain-containing protein [Candidatus Bruticola sp.]